MYRDSSLRPRARAFAGSVSSVTFCSTASHFEGPRIAAAWAVCCGVTLYGTAPRDVTPLSASIFGPSAATTTGGKVAWWRGLVDAVEIGAHRRQRFLVAMAAYTF